MNLYIYAVEYDPNYNCRKLNRLIYEGKFKPDVFFKIKDFVFVKNNKSYRLSSHNILIQFTQQKKLDEDIEVGHLIERKKN